MGQLIHRFLVLQMVISVIRVYNRLNKVASYRKPIIKLGQQLIEIYVNYVMFITTNTINRNYWLLINCNPKNFFNRPTPASLKLFSSFLCTAQRNSVASMI